MHDSQRDLCAVLWAENDAYLPNALTHVGTAGW